MFLQTSSVIPPCRHSRGWSLNDLMEGHRSGGFTGQDVGFLVGGCVLRVSQGSIIEIPRGNNCNHPSTTITSRRHSSEG